MPTWQLVITGSGTSHGNPPWGYPHAWSTDRRDHRRRSGALLLGPDAEVILIDAGPDLRDQLCDPYARWDRVSYPSDCVVRCDGMLLTHMHADHCHGINELRHLNRLMGAAIRIHGDAAHLAELRTMFPYCFAGEGTVYRYDRPMLETVAVADDQPFPLCGMAVTPFAMSHGPAGRVTGFRIGKLGYCTDVKDLPLAADRHLHGLDLLLLNMLREEPHPTHLNREEALAIVDRLRPRRTVLTHIGYEVRAQEWEGRLPPGVELAVDGWSGAFHG